LDRRAIENAGGSHPEDDEHACKRRTSSPEDT
jgi:hypothetical protein